MRYKRYKQTNITHIIPKNKISQELEGISAILDANPRIVETAYEDLTKGCNANDGREGMTAEQVVRSAILKQYRNLNYEELSFHLEDSNAFRAFAHTPEAGGKVDKSNLTQFGRAMSQLGIKMIAAYSPEASGRSERAFRTHQDRLVKELAMAGITEMEQANDYLANTYMPAHNAEFAIDPQEPQSVFVPWAGTALQDILCEQYDRTVGNDNCVKFEGLKLQIPPDQYRCHYVRVAVSVHRYHDGGLAIFHGPRKLAGYDPKEKESSVCSHVAA